MCLVYGLLQVCRLVRGFLEEQFWCSIVILGHDPLYRSIMSWMARDPQFANKRNLSVRTAYVGFGKEDANDACDNTKRPSTVAEGGERQYPNYSNEANQYALQFVPAQGTVWFTTGWRCFTIERSDTISSITDKKMEVVKISSLGRLNTPLKQLIKEIRLQSDNDTSEYTTCYRPGRSSRGADVDWQSSVSRPIRPVATVVLEKEQKELILKDMNEYFFPDTEKWYARRGIPLRRGYLLHGPPGTGKTSLSFALAGVFGINIYVINLRDVNDSDLIVLLLKLPRRCIVLLEDIDSAGLRRMGGDGVNNPYSKSKKRRQKKERPIEEEAVGGVSLAGLLNAIDGVGAHEGRALIVTTNKPDSLDKALIRDGRIDVHVAFTHTTRSQASELFNSMYKGEKAMISQKIGSAVEEPVRDEELRLMSQMFGQKIPDRKLTPAEIQGFLLKRKNSPRKALEEVTQWIMEKQN